MGDPFKNGKPMGTHWVNCKYLFSNQILSVKMHIIGKLINFYIDSCNKLSNIEKVSRVIGGFLINPALKCFEISLIFHGLLLSLQKKIEMKISLDRSQESLEKNSWVPIAMLWTRFAHVWFSTSNSRAGMSKSSYLNGLFKKIFKNSMNAQFDW